MDRPNPAEEKEAARLEEFLDELRHNPTATPGEIDPTLAEIVGLAVEAEQEHTLAAKPYAETAKNRVWQKALTSVETEKPTTEPGQAVFASKAVKAGHTNKESATRPAYLLPDTPVRNKRTVNWPRLVVGGMAATIVVILGLFAVALFSPSSKTPPLANIVGAGTSQAIPGNATLATPTLAVPTATLQPTPTPYPSYKVTLRIAADKFTTDQANATARTLESRMVILGFAYAKATVNGNQITLNLHGNMVEDFDMKGATSTGRVEFVDISGRQTFKAGDYLQTTYCSSGSLLKPQTALCVPTADELKPGFTPTGNANQDGKPFQTVLTGEDIIPESLLMKKGDTGYDVLQYTFKPDATAIMKNYTEGHLGQQMAITLDRKVIVDATVQGVISDKGELTSPTKLNMDFLIAFVKSGPLSLPVTLVAFN